MAVGGGINTSILFPAASNPTGVAVDPTSGDVYVSDYSNEVVYRYQLVTDAGAPTIALTRRSA